MAATIKQGGDLHTQALNLMEKLNDKYNLKDQVLSLDEYYYEYSNIINPNEVKEVKELIDKFWNELAK